MAHPVPQLTHVIRIRPARQPPPPMLSLRLPLLLLLLLLGGCAQLPSRQSQADTLRGQTFVVTGASSGIGRGVALALAARGANVVLAARGTEALAEAARQAEAAGGQALVMTTDVSRPADVQALAAAAVARFGGIDAWINNAGVGAIGRFEQVPLADHDRIVDVNLKGVIHGSHVALTQFKRQGHGTLINIGSMESVVPLPYQASYAATKYAVLGLGRALNEELRLAGLGHIAVATVLPWATDTPYYEHSANYSGHQPRSMLLDPTSRVVETVLWTLRHPREEVPVGWKGVLAYFAHWLFDDLTESIAASLYHHQQMEVAPPAPDTAGTLYLPAPGPGRVEGTTRARIRAEDAAQKRAEEK